MPASTNDGYGHVLATKAATDDADPNAPHQRHAPKELQRKTRAKSSLCGQTPDRPILQ
jgi:hypothetical protein